MARVGLLSSGEVADGEGGVGDGAERKREQTQLMVVAGDAIGAERAAAAAAMDDRPFAVLSDLDGDGFHRLAAGVAAVARLIVEMTGVEAGGAVVAMLGAPA